MAREPEVRDALRRKVLSLLQKSMDEEVLAQNTYEDRVRRLKAFGGFERTIDTFEHAMKEERDHFLEFEADFQRITELLKEDGGEHV